MPNADYYYDTASTEMSIERKLQIAREKIRNGEIIVLTDDADRENEGDAVMAAQLANPEKINFLITHCKGLVCCPITHQIASRLQLPPMWTDEKERAINPNFKSHNHITNFTISIDHKSSTTGISASERARTLREMANPKNSANDFVRPGHIFPLLSNKHGLKKRKGHTEATIWLLEYAQLEPVGVICEIINKDGTMAREKQLENFCINHDLFSIKIADIIAFMNG